MCVLFCCLCVCSGVDGSISVVSLSVCPSGVTLGVGEMQGCASKENPSIKTTVVINS